jgi:hypothetical protein
VCVCVVCEGKGCGLHCFLTVTAQGRGFGWAMRCAVYMSLGLVCAWKAAIVVYVCMCAVQGWRECVAYSFAAVDCCASLRALCVGVVCM